MLEYRCYLIDPSGHVQQPAVVVRCASDAEALAEARRVLGHDVRIEVWQRTRCVGRLCPDPTCGGAGSTA
ncbi:hypothetical protein [Rhodopila sp.]|uniref:hypothetical protein n=1 Tax=Rhodopila sp. TaxID=2480087 RepID=UPI002BE678FA|nr:hypothetical protein [Rhodopila sp.]HVZ06993.1 hypothetical protein [Rhodopila sp.]